ncbi:hypothetical protein D3C73_897650 [compost metagenome]
MQSADEETRAGATKYSRLARRPGASAIIRDAFPDSIESSDQHPETAVSPLNKHMLVEVTIRNVCRTSQLEACSLICRYVHIRKSLLRKLIQRRFMTSPHGNRQQPFPVLQHRWFIHHNTISYSSWTSPDNCVSSWVRADRSPHPAASIVPAITLGPEYPQASRRILPQARIEGTHLLWGIDHIEQIRPRMSAILAFNESDVITGALSCTSTVEGCPQPVVGSAFDTGDSLPLTNSVAIPTNGLNRCTFQC